MEYALSLGSNLGRRLENLRDARRRILSIPGVRLLKQSPVYETEPQDVPAEYRERKFLNSILIVESRQTAVGLSDAIHGVESDMGRRRSGRRNTPRIVDVDIIYAGRRRMDRPSLKIPHPRWSQRRFVVQPLCDVRPDRRLPGEGRSVREVLAALPARPRVSRYRREW